MSRKPGDIKQVGQQVGALLILELGPKTCVVRCSCGNVKAMSRNGLSRPKPYCCCKWQQLTKRRPAKYTAKDRACPEFAVWVMMNQRCYNTKSEAYRFYGAKGVTVCEAWRDSYYEFIKDMGCRPQKDMSIDRINPFGNYEPENCRWVVDSVQQHNKRADYLKTHG